MQTTDPLATPSPAQRHWQDLELGMFFHFDISVYAPGWEWRTWENLPDPNAYQPTHLDTDQWMEAAKAMGAKYAIFVAKHCSGFLQWQSDLYPYGVKQSSWRNGKGDVVGEFINACHKHGIKPGLYASVSANCYLNVDNPGLVNRGKGGDTDAQKRYVDLCERMMEELWSRYGKLYEVWFDGGAIPVDKGGPDLIPLLNHYQPNAIVFQGPPGTPNMIRWVGNERGVAPYPCWSGTHVGTSSDGISEACFDGAPDGPLWIPGECDVPIRNHEWFWQPNQEHLVYPLGELMDMYYCSVGRNCNLLLNANPGPDGLIPASDFSRYVEFGEAIQNTTRYKLASTSGISNEFILRLPPGEPFDHIIIMEDITHGENILSYGIDRLDSQGNWKTIAKGQSIGHKRIHPTPTLQASMLRLTITQYKHPAHIRDFSVYSSQISR